MDNISPSSVQRKLPSAFATPEEIGWRRKRWEQCVVGNLRRTCRLGARWADELHDTDVNPIINYK